MRLKTAQIVVDRIYAVLSTDQSMVTDWERKFIDDMWTRQMEGESYPMTAKQVEALRRICEKVLLWPKSGEAR